MAKIHTISSCLVRMASNTNGGSTSPTPKILELTPWDLRLLFIQPLQRGIFFHYPSPPETIIDHLKNSLSRTLDFFPPLSGRLVVTENDDNTISYHIDCNDVGVEFSHAVAEDLTVSDITEAKYVPEIVSSLFPFNEYKNYEGTFKPLLGIQVTKLVDGLFIGCMANHSVVDGTSFWHFFNSWSEISRGLATVSMAPVFDRWLPSSFSSGNPRIHLPRWDVNRANDIPNPPLLLRKIFKFSKENLAKLKAKANEESGGNNISTFQALLAHLWHGILRNRHPEIASDNSVHNERTSFLIPIGTRPRIPLPEGYFGNAVNSVIITTRVQEVLQNGFAFAARRFNEVILQQNREAIIKFVEEWLKTPAKSSVGQVNSFVTSSPRHNVYGCDFGWGKPVAVRTGIIGNVDGRITVYPGVQPGDVDAEVCLAQETLKALENDEAFMEVVTD